jgi:hypothetical protein
MSHFRTLSALFLMLTFLAGVPALADESAIELKMIAEN